MSEENKRAAQEIRHQIQEKLRKGEAIDGAEATYIFSRMADVSLQTLYTLGDSLDQLKAMAKEVQESRKEFRNSISELLDAERKKNVPSWAVWVFRGTVSLLITIAGVWLAHNDQRIGRVESRMMDFAQHESNTRHWLETLDNRTNKLERKQ